MHIITADPILNSFRFTVHGLAVKFPEWFYRDTLREPCDLIIGKTYLCMFQFAPVRI